MTSPESLIGLTFNRLTIIEFVRRDKYNNLFFKCLCSCGNYSTATYGSLKHNRTKSCGCYNQELRINRATHGQAGRGKYPTAEYRAWQNMKNRCTNKKLKCYPDYGGRGIAVCERWQDSFESFFSDMGKRPTRRHSLDRFPDTNGNYESSNCRWATKKQQQQNTRHNAWFEYNGVKKIASEWSRDFGVVTSCIYHHLKKKSFPEIVEYYNSKK